MKFNVVVEKDEDGYYLATVPSLPGCHTQARSLDELRVRIEEALELYLVTEEGVEAMELPSRAPGPSICPPIYTVTFV